MNLGQILEESNVFLPKTINQVLSSVEVQEEIGIQNKHQILQLDWLQSFLRIDPAILMMNQNMKKTIKMLFSIYPINFKSST